ncbi:MAG TPA: YegS/Rv2252/BmrU family lipid kinase [Bacillales bacterium]|nr:YegS/Rv2252/BmrU family lipid kinase [Bacillales bacterium]
MTKASIIYNPKAGNKKLSSAMDQIVARMLDAYDSVSLYETKKPGDGADYVRRLENKTDVVVTAGGDGTVNEIAGTLCALDNRPSLAVIPGGTCNDFSRAIGMAQHPLRAVEQIVRGKKKSIEVGCFENRYFLNFWGIGLITEVSSEIDPRKKASLGRLAYYISALQNLSNPKSFHLRLESEDRHFEGEAVMVIVGNGPFTGGVRAFFPRLDVGDGKLDVLIVKRTSLRFIWSWLHSKVYETFPVQEDNLIHFRTKKLRISADPEQLVDCDGERGQYTPAEVFVLPEHLDVLIGDLPN